MRVLSHRLLDNLGNPVTYEATPNVSARRTITPRFLVIHYTAGGSFDSTVAWFKNRDANASAHLVIGRDGEITQMAAFNRRAWHAGVSSWNDLNDLNSHSIGIELDNSGELTRQDDGAWKSWFQRTYPSDQVLTARHRHDEADAEPSGWHAFTEAQLDVCLNVALALHAKYNFEGILGHDDIAPGRKRDPGPAFPMAAFRARILGRGAES